MPGEKWPGEVDARNAPRMSKRPNKTRPAWQFFPLYGLSIQEDDGLHAPIFGDATLVSPSFVEQAIRSSGSKPHALLQGGRIADVLPVETLDGLGPPRTHLTEIPPPAFLAVRRRDDLHQAKRRADEIRALLSASMFMRASRLQAFASEPREIAWYAVASGTEVAHGQPTTAQIKVVMNEHVIQNPLEARKKDLRKSWKTGAIIRTRDNLQWDIHREHPVMRLLGEQGKKGRPTRLVDAALHLQRTTCAVSYSIQLRMAVTALEYLLSTNRFEDLRDRALPFFRGDPRLDRVLEARNELTHQLRVPEEEDVKQVARDAIVFAWLLFDIRVGYADSFDSQDQYDRFLEAQATAQRLDEMLVALADKKNAGAVTKLAASALRERFRCVTTFRVKRPSNEFEESRGEHETSHDNSWSENGKETTQEY